MKTDILPLGIVGCEEYNWNPFKRKQIKVMLGEPISYNQELDEIFEEWGTKVATLTGYEYVRDVVQLEQSKTEQPVNAN